MDLKKRTVKDKSPPEFSKEEREKVRWWETNLVQIIVFVAALLGIFSFIISHIE